MTGRVYFLQGAEGGPVKIGYTARQGDARLNEVQPAYPFRLRTLLAVPAEPKDERQHHELFSHLRLNGEWFKPGRDLLQYIEDARRSPEHFYVPLWWVWVRQQEAREAAAGLNVCHMRPRHVDEPWCMCPQCRTILQNAAPDTGPTDND